MKSSKYSVNKSDLVNILLVGLIVIISGKYLYLFKLSNNNYINFTIILILILLLINLDCIIIQKYDLLAEIIILFFIIGYTILISKSYLNQPIKLIIDGNRFMLYYFLYFPIIIIFKKYINRKIIKRVIESLGVIFSILSIIQYILYPNVIFMKGLTFAYRFGELRCFLGATLVINSFILLFSEIFNENSIRFKIICTLSCAIEYYYILDITKTRNIFIALTIAIIAIILIQKKYSGYKKLIIIGSILLIAVTLFKDQLQRLIELTINDTTGTGEDRKIFIKYVLDNIKNTWYLGHGLTSAQFSKVTYHIYDDIGFFGFYFEFGIIGLLWCVDVVFKFLRKSYKLYKYNSKESYYFIMYLVYNICISPFGCVFNGKQQIIFFVITYAILETEVREISGGN